MKLNDGRYVPNTKIFTREYLIGQITAGLLSKIEDNLGDEINFELAWTEDYEAVSDFTNFINLNIDESLIDFYLDEEEDNISEHGQGTDGWSDDHRATFAMPEFKNITSKFQAYVEQWLHEQS